MIGLRYIQNMSLKCLAPTPNSALQHPIIPSVSALFQKCWFSVCSFKCQWAAAGHAPLRDDEKHNGALGWDSGDKVGGCYLGWWLANGSTTHKNIVTSQSDQNLISSFSDRFLYKWIRTKRKRIFFPGTFQISYHSRDTYLWIKDMKKWILHNRWPLN